MQQPVSRNDYDRWLVPACVPASFVPICGEGSTLWDRCGKSWVDVAGGIAVNALAHAHPALKLARCRRVTEGAYP